MELYSEADKTIWEEKYMPVSLKKGQKVSLTKGNPGLKNVVVGIGWDINAFDTGGDFDLDAAAALSASAPRLPHPLSKYVIRPLYQFLPSMQWE